MQTANEQQDDTLTGRQKDCLQLLKGGLSSKQIARELGISPRTVDQHIAVALENLGVKSRLEAISRLHDMERLEARKATVASLMPAELISPDDLHDPRCDKRSEPPELSPPTEAQPLVPPLGGSLNTASTKLRLAWMVRLTAFCAMLTCLVLLSVLGVSEMVSSVSQ